MRNPWLLFIVVLLLSAGASNSSSQEWVHPVIKDYGKAHPLPEAAIQPDKDLEYRVIFDVKKSTENSDGINAALWHVARFINVFATAGVQPAQMKLVVIIHSDATSIVLNNDIYKEKTGKDNPNTNIISQLKKAGVQLFVCGQSLADFNYQENWVNADITVALSAQVVLPTFQLKGYALMTD